MQGLHTCLHNHSYHIFMILLQVLIKFYWFITLYHALLTIAWHYTYEIPVKNRTHSQHVRCSSNGTILLMTHCYFQPLMEMFKKKILWFFFKIAQNVLFSGCHKSPVQLPGAIENSLGQSEVQSALTEWAIKI